MPTRSTASRAPGLVSVALLVVAALGALGCEPAKVGGLPEPGPRAVEVTIETTPAGAAVIVDGTPVGNGPVTLKLNPGNHRLKASMTGYFPADQALTVASGDAAKKVALTLVASH